MVLFGSVAKKTSTTHSDVDIALITDEKDIKQELAITGIVQELENKFNRKIQIHYLTEEQFKNNNVGIMNEIKNEGMSFFNRQEYHVMS